MSQAQLKPNPVFYSYVDDAVAEELKESVSETQKQVIWEKMGNELEIAGFNKHKISQHIQDTIESKLEKKLGYPVKINTAHYYRVMARNDWQDPNYARNKKVDPPGDQKNSSIYTGNNSIAVNAVRKLKKTCDVLEISFKELRDEDNKPINIEQVFTKKELDGFFGDVSSIETIIKDAANSKTVVPKNTHGLFRDCVRIESGLLNISSVFLRTRLHMIDDLRKFLTPRQLRKYKRGEEPKQLPIFKPKSREEAIHMGWYGLECPKCNKWRVRIIAGDDKLHCIDCGEEFTGTTISFCRHCGQLFYKEELQEIIKNGKCPNDSCQKPAAQLPRELIEYAKS